MHLWTGPQDGYYYQVGKAIEAASKHMPDEIRIHTCTSNGSANNITALLEGRADFAIVQSDVAHQVWHCEIPLPLHCANLKETSPIHLVTPLFIEKAQVLLRPHLYVSSLAELRSSHCIWLGGKGSGSEPTARMLLEAAGWSREQVAASQSGCAHIPKDLGEALVYLRSGEELDAIIQTRVAPARLIQKALKDSEIQLIGIDWDTVQRMTRDGIYRETSIQESEYPSIGAAVFSIGVPAFLLTRSKTDADAVRAMAELIEDQQDDIEHHLQRNLQADGGGRGDADSDAPAMIDGEIVGPTKLTLVGSKVPESVRTYVDPEAKAYLWPWSIRRGTFIRLAILFLALMAVVVFLRVHSCGRSLVDGYLRELLFVLGGVLAWAIAAMWLQAIEGDLNEHFTTLWASALSLGENVLAKLPLQFSFAPTPTTRNGAALVSTFSYLVASLATIYMLPRITKAWQLLKPGLMGLQPSSPDLAGRKESIPSPAAVPEPHAEEQGVLSRAVGV
jgi:TRAP transporter TAXI family solute receptor